VRAPVNRLIRYSQPTTRGRKLNAGIRLCLALLVCPQIAAAQGFLDQFSYEGLGFSGIGFEFGGLASDRLTSELTGAVRIDYGRIHPQVRVLIGASYFKGDFNASEISEFEDGLERVVRNQPPGFNIDMGTITWSDIEASVDLQYVLEASRRFTNYIGAGFSAHLRNGTGTAIDGTFVEDALDTIDAGLNLSVGTAFELVPQLQFTLDLRGGLASELRSVSARAGIMYRVAGAT